MSTNLSSDKKPKELICVIETDAKLAEIIQGATVNLCKEFDLAFIQKKSLKELDQFLALSENSEATISLLIISQDCIVQTTRESLLALQIQYKTHLVLTAFEDPQKPLKKTETWPVENIIYKPFDTAILQEHIRFSFIRNEKVKTTAVHSSKESTFLEKITPHTLVQLSDFGFTIASNSKYALNETYKFYHHNFVDKRKSSLWAKAISIAQTKDHTTYEFIFSAPSLAVTTSLRLKYNESKNKIKNPLWLGSDKNKLNYTPSIYLQMSDTEELEKLTGYFSRKFKKAQVRQMPESAQKEKLICDLLISDKDFTNEQLQIYFKTAPLYFKISNAAFKNRADAEKILVTETVRLPKPIDRNYMGRLINSFFPNCEETDPNPMNWFAPTEQILHSAMVEVSELSEAAFTYRRDSLLKRGDSQEFALPQEDETELRPILVKIQHANSNPDTEKKYLHQAVFFGVRDDLLKKLRLWMLQSHINHKKSGT